MPNCEVCKNVLPCFYSAHHSAIIYGIAAGICSDILVIWHYFSHTIRLLTVKSTTAHPYIAIFELVRHFDPRMMPWTFRDDISNGAGVIVLTDKHTNRHNWKQCHPRWAAVKSVLRVTRLACHSQVAFVWQTTRDVAGDYLRCESN